MRTLARRPRSASSPAFWALVLYVVAGLCADAHHATVVHAVCAEHGEVVHEVEAPRDATHGACEAADDGQRRHPVARDTEPQAPRGHEHCSPLFGLPEREPIAFVSGPRVAPPAHRAQRAPVSDRRLPDALYRLAPKQSPPAV